MYNVIILSDLHILNKTGAAFSRMYEYSKGLSKIADVSVFLTSLLTRNNFNSPKEIYTRVHITGEISTKRKNFFLNRYFCFFRKKKELDLLIRHFNSTKKGTAIITYNFFSTFWEEIIFLYLLKRSGYRVITERNERSLGITLSTITPTGLIKKFIFIFLKIFEILNSLIKDETVRFYDGVIAISTVLEKWTYRRNRNCLRIPILANHEVISEEPNLSASNINFKIGYSGSISFNRDGVDTLIDAVNTLVKDYNIDLLLTITGYGAKPTIRAIEAKINSMNLSSKVNLAGYVDYRQYLDVLKEQDLFVVIRRNNLQGKFSFSTKIAEYMALGKIVLTTPVSDNKIFIKDNYNGFIVKEFYSAEIAKKIFSIINLPKETLNKIKVEARNTAVEHFKY